MIQEIMKHVLNRMILTIQSMQSPSYSITILSQLVFVLKAQFLKQQLSLQLIKQWIRSKKHFLSLESKRKMSQYLNLLSMKPRLTQPSISQSSYLQCYSYQPSVHIWLKRQALIKIAAQDNFQNALIQLPIMKRYSQRHREGTLNGIQSSLISFVAFRL